MLQWVRKLHLLKLLVWKKINYGILILIELWRQKKQWHGRKNTKNFNFVPKDIQRVLSSYKISEKYNDQEVFYEKYFS